MNENSDRSAHIDAHVSEMVFGMLADHDLERAVSHLADCSDCAESFRAAKTIYESGLEMGTTHVAPEKMVAHAERGLELSAAESQHLTSCSDCRDELALLSDLPEVQTLPWREERKSPSWFGGWKLGGAVVLAAAVGAWFVFSPALRGDRDLMNTHGWVQPRAIEIQVPRSGGGNDPFESAWREALGDYAAERYADASAGFREALSHRPDHAEAWLLLGSCELLQGDTRDASAAFESARRFSDDESVRDEAAWQQIVSKLEAGSVPKHDLPGIRTELERIAKSSHPHADDARSLLGKWNADR